MPWRPNVLARASWGAAVLRPYNVGEQHYLAVGVVMS